MSENLKNVIEYMSRIAEGKDNIDKVFANYCDGNNLHGYTFVKIKGKKVDVEQTKGKSIKKFSGDISEKEIKNLVKIIKDNKLWNVKSLRDYGVPDETQPKIEFKIEGIGGFEVWIWHNDVYKIKEFAEAMNFFLSLASRISNGEVTY